MKISSFDLLTLVTAILRNYRHATEVFNNGGYAPQDTVIFMNEDLSKAYHSPNVHGDAYMEALGEADKALGDGPYLIMIARPLGDGQTVDGMKFTIIINDTMGEERNLENLQWALRQRTIDLSKEPRASIIMDRQFYKPGMRVQVRAMNGGYYLGTVVKELPEGMPADFATVWTSPGSFSFSKPQEDDIIVMLDENIMSYVTGRDRLRRFNQSPYNNYALGLSTRPEDLVHNTALALEDAYPVAE